MAFLRSSVLIKNVLNAGRQRTLYVGVPIHQSQVLSAYFQSGYATSVKPKTVTLNSKLAHLDNTSRRYPYVSRSDIDELMQAIEKDTISLSQSLAAIKYFGTLMVEEKPEVRTELVHGLWKVLQTRNIIDISHYNTLLGVYVENEHSFSVDDILADIASKGLTPNRATFQRLIEKYSQTGDFDGIMKIVEKINEQGLALNTNIYNAFILAYGVAGEIKSAEGVIATMKEAGVEQNHDTSVSLLRAYAKAGDLATIKTEIERLTTEDVLLQERDYLQLVSELAINGHSAESNDLLKSITNKSVAYNRLAANAAVRLLQKGQDETAFNILISMTPGKNEDGSLADSGVFYISQLIKLNRSAEEITAALIKLRETGLHSAPLKAIRSLLDNGKLGVVIDCLRQWKSNNLPLTLDELRPFFHMRANFDVLQLVQFITGELEIKTTHEFIRESVVPKLDLTTIKEVLSALIAVNVPLHQAGIGVAFQCARNGNLEKAANILASFKLFPHPRLFAGSLVHGLRVSNDVDSFTWILQIINDYFKPFNSEGSDETSIANGRIDSIGHILCYTLEKLDEDTKIYTFTAILKNLVNQGMTISGDHADKIVNFLQPKVTNDISMYLNQLASGELEPAPLKRGTVHLKSTSAHLENVIAAGKGRIGVESTLLKTYLDEGNVTKFEEQLQKYNNDNVHINNGVYAQYIHAKISAGNVNDALKLFNEYKDKYPDFYLFNQSVLEMTSFLIKDHTIGETISFLEKAKMASVQDDENYVNLKWARFLNDLAKDGKVEELYDVFGSLVQNNHIRITNNVLGPLVRVHLANNNTQKAVDAFEKLSKEHNFTPLKNIMFMHLINAEDLPNLQKVADASSLVHGEQSSLLDLSFAFVECGRVKQARRIFEMPELNINFHKVTYAVEAYAADGKVDCLENLLKATHGIDRIDRSEILYQLLEVYCREELTEKALKLWVGAQEDGDMLTDRFLIKLGAYLTDKDLKVPFLVPKGDEEKVINQKVIKVEKSKKPTTLLSQNGQQFANALQTTDLDQIHNAYQQLSSAEKASWQYSDAIQKRKIMKALSVNGDLAALEKFEGESITKQNYMVTAYIQSGRVEELLNKWTQDIEAGQTFTFKSFPTNGFIGILEKCPELLSKCEEFAVKVAEKQSTLPISLIWCYYIFTNNADLADKIWTQYLQTAPIINYRPVLVKAFRTQDSVIVQKVINYLKSSENHKSALGGAYNAVLDIHSQNGEFDRGLSILDEIVKTSSIDTVNAETLKRLKALVEGAGKKFPYEINEVNLKKKVNRKQ